MKRFIFLMSLFYLIQLYGGNPGLFDIPLQLYLKETLGYSAQQLAWFATVLVIPWTVKPVWGMISDSYPVFGSTIRAYFILCYTLALGLFAGIGVIASPAGLLLLIVVATASTAIAFSDVLTDKLMVVEGRVEGTTSVLQAAQWAAFSFGGAAMMYLGGWIAQRSTLSSAFLLTALVPFLGLAATLLLVRERKKEPGESSLRRSLRGLSGAVRSRQFLACAAFLAALRLHVYPPLIFYQRDVLEFDPIFIGTWNATLFLANGVGAIVFGLYARNVPRRRLLNFTVGFNVLATLGFIFMTDEKSAIAVAIAVGLTDMIGTLGALEVAARSCPPGIEGTAYALMMSVYNLFSRPGIILGAMLWDDGWSFSTLVLIGTALTAVCWLLIPLLRFEDERVSGAQ